MRHELNNTLQVAITNLEILLSTIGDDPSVARRVNACLQALERTMALVATLPDAPPQSVGQRGLRIVLSEDEALIRMVTASLLSDMGNDVVDVATANEALAALDAPADLLITDLNLPDMSGEDLAVAARARRPGLAVIIASGEEPRTDERGGHEHVWLLKPFNAARLRDAMKAALNGS